LNPVFVRDTHLLPKCLSAYLHFVSLFSPQLILIVNLARLVCLW